MNKYIISSFFVLFATLGLFAGEPADYKLEVKDFSELKVSDGINVEYFCSTDSAGWAYFSVDPALASQLLFTNNKSCLHIQVDTEAVGLPNLPTIKVYSSALAKVENSADSTIVINNNVAISNFKVRVIGNGTIIVRDVKGASLDARITTGRGHIVINSGSVAKANYSNVGTGPLEAGCVNARDVKVTLLGTGNIDCCATESLTIYGAGSGKVYYTGKPAKISNRSLGVKAIDVNSQPTEQ